MKEDTAFSMAVQAMFAYSAGSDKEDLETFEWVNEEDPKSLSAEELKAGKAAGEGELEIAKTTDTDALKVAKAVGNEEFGAGKIADEEKSGAPKTVGEGESEAKRVTGESELDNLGRDENEGLPKHTLTNGAKLNIDETDKTVARLLFCGTVDNLTKIDSVIKANLTKSWTIERMNKVVLSVVRVASYILLYQKDADVGKTVDKAILTARSYTETHASGNRTAGFVNAILDKVAKSRKKQD